MSDQASPHTRTILHADMDAFFAAVEQRDNPGLRGRPVVVGGGVPRGVVAAASYEARTFGIHSAMPMATAMRRCPDLEVVSPRMEHYSQASRRVFSIFRSFSPLVEPLSLDEAFVDLTGTRQLLGSARHVSHELKRRMLKELELVVSIGVAPSKFIAKIASDLDKPDGLVIVAPDEVTAFLKPLPVSRIFGAGKVCQKTLSMMGISTIGELSTYPEDVLRSRFGEFGAQLWSLSRGIDDRPVVPERAPKSIGHEDTFSKDIKDMDDLERIVQEQADRVAARLRKAGLVAGVVTLKIKTATFKVLTRRRSLPRASSEGGIMGAAAREMLRKVMRGPNVEPLRLTGVSGSELSPERAPRQLSFDEPELEKKDRLARTLDSIEEKFGRGLLERASTIGVGRKKR